MQLRRSPSARPIDRDWHRSRQQARERAFSSDLEAQFSEEEIVKYELETAQITGASNPQVWMWRRAIDLFGINGTDVRTLRDH